MTREDDILKRMAQGDTAAAEELIEIFYPEILRYCLWHAPSRALAEDAAQETFLKFLRYFDRYAHRGRLKPFLYRIAANTCIDMARSASGGEVSLDDLPDTLSCSESGFEAVHSDIALNGLIKQLRPEQREVILLRFGQDLTMIQISKVLGIPLRTVQSRLRSALKILKKQLTEEKHHDT